MYFRLYVNGKKGHKLGEGAHVRAIDVEAADETEARAKIAKSTSRITGSEVAGDFQELRPTAAEAAALDWI